MIGDEFTAWPLAVHTSSVQFSAFRSAQSLKTRSDDGTGIVKLAQVQIYVSRSIYRGYKK